MKRLHNLVLFLLTFLLLCQTASYACLNDRDTLAEEIKGLPDVVQVVTGRFERNPPLYYQMRLARVAAELKTNPALLSGYDDAGVACDRLGRDDEAIAWMDKKRVQLSTLRLAYPDYHEQWYRYNANTGTFWVHRWIHNGADRRKIGEVKTARYYIAQAIKIKPNAHFGREKYQLRVMDWIIKGLPFSVLTNILEKRHGWTGFEHDTTPEQDPDAFLFARLGEEKDQTKALCGLITLGNAWESVDIFQALGQSLPVEGGSQLSPLIKLRCDELVDSHHGSLIPGAPQGKALKDAIVVGERNWDLTDKDKQVYLKLRREADVWQKARTDYMMARLTAGRHPDTDPTFWNDYHPSSPPEITDSWQHQLYRKYGGDESENGFWFGVYFNAVLLGFAMLTAGFILWRVKVRRRKRRSLTTV